MGCRDEPGDGGDVVGRCEVVGVVGDEDHGRSARVDGPGEGLGRDVVGDGGAGRAQRGDERGAHRRPT
ncbi:hypothetical protein [Cellulomonas uda]|uniref:Uncharacterized protein n=1 Tax=Cellulomonas uda TaxID=1714 RepID=A0A4Y3KH74_CELUD|nr:hypothetical protein [Cellulomonas uda]NII66272.1 hypothetical protein [Cellulomonas uda]GEA82714.1 hypothetical protein CUD01_31580 [Cellulomonas uda]